MDKIIITNYTDPVCVWCWATEPIFRALETRYPMVDVRYVMGGLVRDIQDFEDADNHIASHKGDINPQVMAHWLETVPHHRMPIESEGFALFSPQTPSSFPQNIAYRAAYIADPKKAERFLRTLRVATLAKAQKTALPEVLEGIAQDSGIDLAAYRAALSSGEAETAFGVDQMLVRSLEVAVFPTFQLKSSSAQQVWMRGFQTRQDFEHVFARLSGHTIQPLPSPPDTDILDWLLGRFGNQTQEEIYQAFDFDSRAAADRWVQDITKSGRYRIKPVGQSYFLLPSS